MSKVLRKRVVDELVKKYQDQKNFFLVGTQGLTANQATELRRELRAEKVRINALKNSIAHHTFEKLGLKDLQQFLTGMNAVITGADPVTAAKKLVAYRDKHQKPEIRAALVDGKLLTAAQVTELSRLPGREQLLAQVLGVMLGVTQQFVSTLNEIPRKFVGTLQAIVDKEKK
ncbi:MAG: 50S ribosomal protein L10 [Planctomycetes bacterium]|nr:50S ribosomal protein L10 [Planctomycetota bacterium]